MRIISGTHGGRRIRAPKSLPVRPTTDRVKEALFNILANQFQWSEIKALDLFAGTGNISLEFASRGIPVVISVDEHAGCTRFIEKTRQELKLPISTVKSEVQKFLLRTDTSFDIIFADPPYDLPVEELKSMVSTIFSRQLLNAGGVLIIEHDKRTKLDTLAYFKNQRNYGGSVLSFFEGEE